MFRHALRIFALDHLSSKFFFCDFSARFAQNGDGRIGGRLQDCWSFGAVMAMLGILKTMAKDGSLIGPWQRSKSQQFGSQLSTAFVTCPVPLGKCLDGFRRSEQLRDSPSSLDACQACRSTAEPVGSQGNQRSPGRPHDNPGNPSLVLLSLAKSSPLFGMQGTQRTSADASK